MSVELIVNGRAYTVDASEDTPLLWILREQLGLTGTKYGCGKGQCGACTVLLNGEAVRSCGIPLKKVSGDEIVTIEGLAAAAEHPVINAWTEADVPQCGFCQPGMVMAATDLLTKNPNPTDQDIDKGITNLCRCGTYNNVRRAIQLASKTPPDQWPAPQPVEASPLGDLPADTILEGDFILGCRNEAVDSGHKALGSWLRIAPSGDVSIYTSHSEMGQGTATGLPMLVAEELEVDWQNVRVVMAPAAREYINTMYGSQSTGGSSSTRESFTHLREAGAAAREMLKTAAANRWGVKVDECRAEKGTVVHESTGKTLSYGELVSEAAALPVPEQVDLKEPGQWSLVGKPKPRIDTPAKVRGAAVYGQDIRMKGLLHAAVVMAPDFYSEAKIKDPEAVLALPGVEAVVKVPTGAAVLAETWWQAHSAAKKLEIEWRSESSEPKDIERLLEEGLSAGEAAVVKGEKDMTATRGSSDRVVESDYHLPFLAHASLEPPNCTAWVREGRCDVWGPTQVQEAAQKSAAKITGLPVEDVHIHTALLGGSFGRMLESDLVEHAVILSKNVGKPVKLIWTRENDLQRDYYRPPSAHRFRAVLGDDGKLAAFTHRISAPSILEYKSEDGYKGPHDPTSTEGSHDQAYDIPGHLVETARPNTGVPLGFWRSVGHSFNAFALECFLDEVAKAEGTDSLELRRRLLKHSPRHLAVLERVAKEAGWGRKMESGHGLGLTFHESYGSIAAQVADVSAGDDGSLKINRVDCAVDCGRAVNPDGVISQMEGGIVFGLTAALFGEITVTDGKVDQSGFHNHPLLKMAHMPRVNVHIMENEHAPGGAGEPGVPPIAPAVVNAIFAATGQRVRRLPLIKQGYKV